MTRTNGTQSVKKWDRSNSFKTKPKSTNDTHVAPRTHQLCQNYAGFTTFFKHLVFVTF